jgi:hypothetical protein
MAEIIFTEGMKAFKPRDTAPEFVKADLLIDVAKFTVFINDHAKPDGTMRVQIREAKTGNYFAALDQWTKPAPKTADAPTEARYTPPEINPDDIPF